MPRPARPRWRCAPTTGTVLAVTTQAGVRHAVGIVTDRDLAVEVLARDVDASRLTVGEAARTQLVAVRGNADVVGILSADDLLDVMTTQLSGLSATLREGVLPATALGW